MKLDCLIQNHYFFYSFKRSNFFVFPGHRFNEHDHERGRDRSDPAVGQKLEVLQEEVDSGKFCPNFVRNFVRKSLNVSGSHSP